MKKGLFIFVVFFMLSAVGCTTAADRPTPQNKSYKNDGDGQIGQALQMGATVGAGDGGQIIAKEDYPGETIGKGTPGGIILLDIKTPVRQGETGSLSIQGKPNTQYTVTAVYNNSTGTITTTSAKRTGSDGKLSWTWNVSRDTMPGTYGLMITGGGKMLTAAYTVSR